MILDNFYSSIVDVRAKKSRIPSVALVVAALAAAIFIGTALFVPATPTNPNHSALKLQEEQSAAISFISDGIALARLEIRNTPPTSRPPSQDSFDYAAREILSRHLSSTRTPEIPCQFSEQIQESWRVPEPNLFFCKMSADGQRLWAWGLAGPSAAPLLILLERAPDAGGRGRVVEVARPAMRIAGFESMPLASASALLMRDFDL